MQVTYCNQCGRVLSTDGQTYWYVKPMNAGDDYCPPVEAYRHVTLCSNACLLQWTQQQGSEPANALAAAVTD